MVSNVSSSSTKVTEFLQFLRYLVQTENLSTYNRKFTFHHDIFFFIATNIVPFIQLGVSLNIITDNFNRVGIPI